MAINPPQVRSRKGRWLRERRIEEFPHFEKPVQVIARVKIFEGNVWCKDCSVPIDDHTLDEVVNSVITHSILTL